MLLKRCMGVVLVCALLLACWTGMAVAQEEEYFALSAENYSSYLKKPSEKVAFTGTVIQEENDMLFISIGTDAMIALEKEKEEPWNIAVDSCVQGKGKTSFFTTYQEKMIPLLVCEEISEMAYRALEKGESSKEVLDMKKRMQALGYFRADASLSELYDDICAERVQMFQENNNLPATGIADAETLNMLYSDAAIPQDADQAKKSQSNTKEDTDSSTSDELVDGLRPEFKADMDSYEEFYDDFCEAIGKHKDNPSDRSMFADYLIMLSELEEIEEKFDAWEDKDMNQSEIKYYLTVKSRVLKKIADMDY